MIFSVRPSADGRKRKIRYGSVIRTGTRFIVGEMKMLLVYCGKERLIGLNRVVDGLADKTPGNPQAIGNIIKRGSLGIIATATGS